MLALLCAASCAAIVTNSPRIAISGGLNERATTYAAEKTNKATARFAAMLNSVDVTLKVERRGGGLHDTEHGGYNVHVAEAVCKLRRDKRVVRVCSESESMHESLDMLSERLSRQLRKCKDRKVGATRHAVGLGAAAEPIEGEAGAEEVAALVVEDQAPREPDAAAEELLSELRAEYLGELDDEMLTQLRAEDDEDLDPTKMHRFATDAMLEAPMSDLEAAEAIDIDHSAHSFRVYHHD